MYTSYIGLKFLELYNRKMATHHTAASFFDEVMFPMFFDDERHLMHVSNSPFFQKPADKDLKASGLSKAGFQYSRLREKISASVEENSHAPDGSFYVGYGANGPDQTTAGQMTTMSVTIEADDIYASWIGNALAARVEGSQCILPDSEAALWHIYEGWGQYRKYLRPTQLEGRQLETWNGYWLAKGELNRQPAPTVSAGKIQTQPWLEVFARLLQWHPGSALPLYIFSLGQTNTTFGFINLHLPELRRLSEAYHTVKSTVAHSDTDSDADFWEKYRPDFSLRKVCELGEIGLRGLRPTDWAKLMEAPFSTPRISEKNTQTYLYLKTWIIAMLNNKEELKMLAAELAAALLTAEAEGKNAARGKTTDSIEIKAVMEARGVVSFIIALSDLVEKKSGTLATSRQAVDAALRISPDLFPLFKALIRFEYIALKNQ